MTPSVNSPWAVLAAGVTLRQKNDISEVVPVKVPVAEAPAAIQ